MTGSQPCPPLRRPPKMSRLRRAAAWLMFLGSTTGATGLGAQQSNRELSPKVAQQITALMADKAARSPAQRKISSQLIFAARMARGEPITSGVNSLQVTLPGVDWRGAVLDVRAEISDTLLGELRALGAEILDVSVRYRNVRVRVDLLQVDVIAALPAVIHVQPKQEAITSRLDGVNTPRVPARGAKLFPLARQQQAEVASAIAAVQYSPYDGPITAVGRVNSEGDTTHRANLARTAYGVSGAGVRIGVISDGVTSLAASQGAGDLGSVTILPGQAGTGDEGTAMLEIVRDLAPGAQLYFATALGGPAVFAANIRALRAAGCDIIVDDVGYPTESPFQDGQTYTSTTNGGIIAQAVKEVAAAGTLYFSAAANSGNKNDGESGTWEGNFVDAGDAGPAGRYHNFGGQNFNVLRITSPNPITLFWSDPLGASGNDYDLFRLSSDGSTVLSSSTDAQDGNDDPFEIVSAGSAGQLIVIVKYSGSDRFLHLDTSRNRLQISTAGSTHGHAATTAVNSFGVAATPARGPYPAAFNAGNKIETFSSDGPRRLFYAANGAPFTPGNLLSTGGLLLQKPDFAAADGVAVTGAGGFPSPFFGTSASAPHAAAIAALVKSKNLAQTPTQVRAALFSSAVDIEGPGVDRDSGIGIIMADAAVAAASLPPSTAAQRRDFDGDLRTDLAVFRPSNGSWYVRYSSFGYAVANAGTFQWGLPGDVPISGDFDNDGKIELTVFRPSNGSWYIRFSSLNYSPSDVAVVQWGLPGDIPIAGDFDGDGQAELTVFRPSNGTWYIRYSSVGYSLGSAATYQWGLPGDTPIAGDFDGDGRTELNVFRPSNGTWYLRYSSLNYSPGSAATYQWGLPGDTPIAADFDGDGRTELTVYRPSNGTWYLRYSSLNYSLGSSATYQWGLPGDFPVTAEFDGDGKAELTIFRPATAEWFVSYSTIGYSKTSYGVYQWGLPGDTLIK